MSTGSLILVPNALDLGLVPGPLPHASRREPVAVETEIGLGA